MPRLTPALMRALDIIDLFVDRSPELSAAEIAEATDLPRTSVYELLGTLVHRGYLVRDAAGVYSLGVRALQIGVAAAGIVSAVLLGAGMIAHLLHEIAGLDLPQIPLGATLVGQLA